MKKNITYLSWIIMFMGTISCNRLSPGDRRSGGDSTVVAGSFAYDRKFLSHYDDNLVILKSSDSESQVAISPRYQAKVFTSTAAGDSGRSFGWVNYKVFGQPHNAHMNAYGGENRMWLGPEGGKFSLFFDPGTKMEFANWKTPPAIDTETWTVTSQNGVSVSLEKNMELTNYTGTRLNIEARRSINLLNRDDINNALGMVLNDSLREVAYETINTVTNKGIFAWNEKTGMPCIWMLDMFNPSPETVIIVPFKTGPASSFDQTVTSDYFGAIPPERLLHKDSVLFFKADGKSRVSWACAPIGLKPRQAVTIIKIRY